jgi:2,3-bisphosphoglycerate-dependent phosphoglycerate mutase
MAIYLIRHGETDANAARIVQRPDVALSARGRTQAAALARRLASVGIGAIVSSDLRRAAETAAALHATTGAAISWDPGLHERNYGDVRGTAYAELTEDIFGPTYAPPSGETWEQFHARVDAAWRQVLSHVPRTVGHVAVVTHGLVCQRILAAHLDPPPGCVVSAVAWGNTCLTVIDGPAARRVDTLACVAHLADQTAGARV